MDKPSCGGCRYYGGTQARNGHALGECRKHTPRVDRDGAAAWPLVKPSDWCGEFAPVPRPPRAVEAVER